MSKYFTITYPLTKLALRNIILNDDDDELSFDSAVKLLSESKADFTSSTVRKNVKLSELAPITLTNGFAIKYEIEEQMVEKRTGNVSVGMGVVCQEDIEKDTLIGAYIGKIHSNSEGPPEGRYYAIDVQEPGASDQVWMDAEVIKTEDGIHLINGSGDEDNANCIFVSVLCDCDWDDSIFVVLPVAVSCKKIPKKIFFNIHYGHDYFNCHAIVPQTVYQVSKKFSGGSADEIIEIMREAVKTSEKWS